MKIISYTEARQNLKQHMTDVCENHTPIVITNQMSKEEVIMMSLKDYNSYEETAYLMRSPKNAERLLQSIQEAKEGKLLKRDLIEIEDDNK